MEYISCALFVACLLECVLSFNLELRLPIIKRGDANSYFGYSVAQHQSVDEVPPNNVQSWLLVGAPLGQNLQPNTNKSGALFKCPITTALDDCTQVVTDGKRDPVDGQYNPSIDKADLLPPLNVEIKDGQWLGVTVQSQGRGGKVMVCAHRHIKRGVDFQWGQGMCYTLTQYLDYSNTWDPCKGRPTNKAHEQFGYCQAGTSGLLLEDDMAVIGTPGPYTWRGTMFVMNISSDFFTRDKTFYYSPLKEPGAPKNEASPVDKYSYLGMAVGAGKFFDNKVMYVAGAPRANGTGQVVFFSWTKGQNPMEVELILSGEQFASSYGYELTTGNIDGDNYTDLVVGAPFFFNRTHGGTVYVYTRLKRHCIDCNKPVVLAGKLESRFGFALTNLGDLNKDGYEDIAVGAPYEGSGVIYIYLGSKKGLLQEPSQILRAEDLPPGSGTMRTFGYSLSGGLDLDQNGYPDLLIGAYEEDAIVLLRARPIIGITTSVEPKENLMNIDPSKPGCRRYPSSPYTCFTFSACFEMQQDWAGGTELSLNYSYSIEAEARTLSRVWFEPFFDTRAHSVKKFISFNPKRKREHCEDETVYLKENITDIQSPIQFRLTYKLVQREPRQVHPGERLPSVDNFPILNQQEASRTFEATFQKDCGTNDICESHLFVTAYPDLPHGRKPYSWEIILGKHEQVNLNISVHNLNESAYAAQLFVSHPPSLKFMTFKSKNKQQTCKPSKTDNVTVVCDLGNPFKKEKPAYLLISFDPKGLTDSEGEFKFIVFANSTSQEVDPEPPLELPTEVIRQAEVSLTSQVQPDRVLYGGEVVGESAIHTQKQVGSRVQHMYIVKNKGPWRVSGLEVFVEWPFQVGNNKPQGKWLLYLAENPVVDAKEGGQCYMETGQVNPLNLREDLSLTPSEDNSSLAESHTRSKRDTEMVIIPEVHIDKDGRRRETVTMDCLLGTAKCIVFRCVIRELPPKQEAAVIVRARLWNSTLVEDYPKVDSVHIRSHAKIHLPEKPFIHQNISDDASEAETIALPDRLDQHKPEPVPIWIIIVAVVAGLLLLVVLTLGLWKLGFFKRRRPDPTLSGNLEKHHDENGDYSS